MRIKSRFKSTGKTRSLEEIATALAYIAWQIAKGGAQNMQTSGWEVHTAAQRFEVLGEFVAFLIQVADRLAYRRLSEDERQRFMTGLSARLLSTLVENQIEVLGPGDYRTPLVARLNTRLQDYSELDFDDNGPSYAFLRYFGGSVAEVMGERDRPWSHAQVIDIEGPEAVKALEKAMKDLFASAAGSEPRSAPLPEHRATTGRIGED